MKKISVLMMGIILMALQSIAQTSSTTAIEPQTVTITYSKTTNLVFPYAIKSVDKGSRDVLVQKAPGVENVLQLKAATPEFTETNLTVLTADGSLYSYALRYAEFPEVLSIRVGQNKKYDDPLVVFKEDATNAVIKEMSEKAWTRKPIIGNLSDEQNDIRLAVTGIYVHDDVLYFQLALNNASSINYDIQSLRFFIRDKKRSKRTASQETDLEAIYVVGNNKKIRGQSQQYITVALPKFSIPEKKYLAIQIMENDGGRHLDLKVNNKAIMHSKTIY